MPTTNYDAWKTTDDTPYSDTLPCPPCDECGTESPRCPDDCPTVGPPPSARTAILKAKIRRSTYLAEGNLRGVVACERQISTLERMDRQFVDCRCCGGSYALGAFATFPSVALGTGYEVRRCACGAALPRQTFDDLGVA